MNGNRWRRIAPVALYFLMSAALAGAGSFTEDFTATTYRDDVNTTADWNTVTGELGLFPFNINQSGSFNTTGRAFGVAVDGNLAFVADQLSGLQVIDITDPANPILVGTLDTPVAALGVAVDGDHAFIADSTTGLLVIDVSDPTFPALLGTYDTPGFASRVAVAGDLAFVADLSGDLQVVDVSNPLLPAGIGSLSTLGSVNDVAVDGNYVYLADTSAGLIAVDISDPTNPAIAGILVTGGGALGLVVDGDHVFFADDSQGLKIIDVSDPTSPFLAGSFDTPNRAYDVAVAGDKAYVADGATGLMVLDISNPASPTLRDSFNTTGTARDVAVAGTHAFIAGDFSGLQVIEVSARMELAFASLVGTPGNAWDVEVDGNYAYVAADGSGGLQVIDITDLSAPFIAGSINSPGAARGITVAGNHAFVAEGGGGLSIFDISNPTNPVLAGSIANQGFARRVAVAGDLAFLADEINGGLKIYDISDPTMPVFVGENLDVEAFDVVVAGDHAFIADNFHGLRVVNVSDPANPTLIGTLTTSAQTQGLAVSGNYAFVAAASELVVADISDPANPVEVGSLVTDFAWTVEIAGDHLFIGGDGITMVDISDPLNPFIVSQFSTFSNIAGGTKSGEYYLGGSNSGGVTIVRAFQDEVVSTQASGRSLALDNRPDTIIRARVSPVQSTGVDWMLSADDGAVFQAFAPGVWSSFNSPGPDLRWGTTHIWAPGVNPTVSEVTIDWLYEAGDIASITDVADDQGGRVYIDVIRSGLDFVDESSTPATQYGIYRRVDEGALAGKAVFKEDLARGNRLSHAVAVPIGVPSAWIDNQLYVKGSGGAGKAATFPSGTWALVGSVPATQSDGYLVEATTVADSSGTGPAHATYLVTTHTTVPAVWFVSLPDSGYSVDNIAPAVPTNLIRAGSLLTWDESSDPDFGYFSVYGSVSPEFDGGAQVIGHTIEATLDISAQPFAYFHVTATDDSGNQGAAATLQSASSVPGLTGTLALHGAVPNPFNLETRISFELAASGRARLTVYDAAGHRVATLVDERREAGLHEVTWDGRDDNGRLSATGVYLYRLETQDVVATKRMTLVK